jgi:relaxase/mobilization nuclease
MPILKSIGDVGKTVGSLKAVLNYVSRKGKNENVLCSGIGVADDSDKAFNQFMFNKRIHNQVGGKMYKHYVQSFSSQDNITPEMAHEIAVKFAEENFLERGFKCYVATHTDKGHIHSHIVLDNVNTESGLKYKELDEKELKKNNIKKGTKKKN